ncbi:hypothetical protein [Yersinia ruckeri]|uniref:hypothetical protein n=1 Tax=Yersinia ruckeri TaxID=29486 RepID=UPI0022375F53|nr:hypothetical protein [Yersinia ruckeri]MCW6568118.1 hypothetical protein [Yersinia ruckeri]
MNIHQLFPRFINRHLNHSSIENREMKPGIGSNLLTVGNVNLNIPDVNIPRTSVIAGKINDGTMNEMLKIINQGVKELLSSKNIYQYDAIDEIKPDMPRMNYYINNELISVPGDIDNTLENYKSQISRESNSHIRNNMAAISSFANQGIFMIFYEAMSNLIVNDSGEKKIVCLTLDPGSCKNDFYFFSDGRITFHSEAGIKNAMLQDRNLLQGEVLHRITDHKESHLSLNLSFLLVGNQHGEPEFLGINEENHYNISLKFTPDLV